MIQTTTEQNKIISIDLSPGQVLKILAFAGTGKTTTLVAYTRKRPQMRFLYMAFNKSVQLEAAKKFPANVMARTAHSLAFQAKGFQYKDRLVKGFRANQVMAALDLDNYETARFTMDTLHRFLSSADPVVSALHVPAAARSHYQRQGSKMPDLVDYANQLGRLMCNGQLPDIGMVHDGYLKLYQLSGPALNFDCILLDEAQDINPVVSAIVLSQVRPETSGNAPAVIVVGDNHQQIYSFRGARDTLNSLAAHQTCYLTQSFRFDNNIAKAANMVLSIFKKETRRLRGTMNQVPKSPWDPERYTIIARTNAVLFDRAVQLYKTHDIGFAGGIQGYRLDLLKSVSFLHDKAATQVQDPFINGFSNFTNLKSYAAAVEDLELSSVCAVVEKYGPALRRHVDRIKETAVTPDQAGILLTTAHKAKGLEWDNVLVMDDFVSLVKDGRPVNPAGVDPDEFNLIYVAMTRARVHLRFHKNSSIPLFIRLVKQKSRN
ncbi:MAG: UvrD-helicase domain-containing protein [Desulfotignum sp.]|nr:UvrD-helicase domain-containing protein [Desulfotignum sp.]